MKIKILITVVLSLSSSVCFATPWLICNDGNLKPPSGIVTHLYAKPEEAGKYQVIYGIFKKSFAGKGSTIWKKLDVDASLNSEQVSLDSGSFKLDAIKDISRGGFYIGELRISNRSNTMFCKVVEKQEVVFEFEYYSKFSVDRNLVAALSSFLNEQ